MRNKWILIVIVLVTAVIAAYLMGSGDDSGLTLDSANTRLASKGSILSADSQIRADSYVTDYIVDKQNQIPFKDTHLNEQRPDTEAGLSESIAIGTVNRDTVDYFRFLQTHFNEGSSLQENTALIHQHLLTTLPRDKGEELFALYQKFVDFEFSVGEKTKGWKMPESANETLELIKKMQQLQQQHFGVETADLLFGGELKTMEYTARRSGILNDQSTPGAAKEALLNKLAVNMFGTDADKLDAQKNPYNLFEEKLLIYKNDLDKLGPTEREKMINDLRARYLPNK